MLIGFMLASPVETVEEALKRFSTELADEGLAWAGDQRSAAGR